MHLKTVYTQLIFTTGNLIHVPCSVFTTEKKILYNLALVSTFIIKEKKNKTYEIKNNILLARIGSNQTCDTCIHNSQVLYHKPSKTIKTDSIKSHYTELQHFF